MSKQYTVDPNDEKLLDTKTAGENTLTEYEKSMQGAINANTAARDEALGALGVDENGKVIEGSATDRLIDSQNKQTDFTIETIKQQKQQAEKDYIKEQSAAYTDYQKQIDPYGVNAERMAAQGLQNSGYAESSKVATYNQYQARITAARETFAQIKLEYDNAITQARLQNDATLAQIIVDAMQKRLEIVTQFAFKNTELLTTLAREKAAIKQQNFSNYMAVYNQILEENKYKTSVEQFNENMAFQREQFNWQKAQAEKASSGGGGLSISKGYSGKKKQNDDYANKVSNAVIGKKPKEKEETSEPEVDMDSVLALGYGPISPEALNRLVSQGKAEEYIEDGKLKYRKKYQPQTQPYANRLKKEGIVK